jgi:hypothetical protein
MFQLIAMTTAFVVKIGWSRYAQSYKKLLKWLVRSLISLFQELRLQIVVSVNTNIKVLLEIISLQ